MVNSVIPNVWMVSSDKDMVRFVKMQNDLYVEGIVAAELFTYIAEKPAPDVILLDPYTRSMDPTELLLTTKKWYEGVANVKYGVMGVPQDANYFKGHYDFFITKPYLQNLGAKIRDILNVEEPQDRELVTNLSK